MAFKNSPMTYTQEDIWKLRASLKGEFDPHFPNDPCSYHYIVKIDEDKVTLYNYSLADTIDGTHPLLDTRIRKFLHETPLEDVPLYINRYPELAKWRLSIAK